MSAPGHAGSLLPPDPEQQEEEQKKQEDKLNSRLKEESSAFFSSGRLWDDGVILPQDTRKVKQHFFFLFKLLLNGLGAFKSSQSSGAFRADIKT